MSVERTASVEWTASAERMALVEQTACVDRTVSVLNERYLLNRRLYHFAQCPPPPVFFLGGGGRGQGRRVLSEARDLFRAVYRRLRRRRSKGSEIISWHIARFCIYSCNPATYIGAGETGVNHFYFFSSIRSFVFFCFFFLCFSTRT